MTDPNSPVPMYKQIAQELVQEINSGLYAPGEKLPSENELRQKYGVSRVTVRNALNLLTQQNIIYSVHGKGTFTKLPSLHNELAQIVSFKRVLRDKGLTGYTRVDSYTEDCGDPRGAKHFSGPFARLTLCAHVSGAPAAYYISYLSPSIAPTMWALAREEEARGQAFSTYDLHLKANTLLSRIEQKIYAVNADKELADILAVKKGMALIVLKSAYYDENNELIEYKYGYYRSDIYFFTLHRSL